MAKEKKPGFWKNPIADRDHAERICKSVANVYILVCLATGYFLYVSHNLIIAAALVIYVIATFLLRQKYNLYAAYTLFGLALLSLIGSGIDVVHLLIDKAPLSKIYSSALSTLIAWLFVTATWRACKAIKKFLMPSP